MLEFTPKAIDSVEIRLTFLLVLTFDVFFCELCHSAIHLRFLILCLHLNNPGPRFLL